MSHQSSKNSSDWYERDKKTITGQWDYGPQPSCFHYCHDFISNVFYLWFTRGNIFESPQQSV